MSQTKVENQYPTLVILANTLVLVSECSTTVNAYTEPNNDLF